MPRTSAYFVTAMVATDCRGAQLDAECENLKVSVCYFINMCNFDGNELWWLSAITALESVNNSSVWPLCSNISSEDENGTEDCERVPFNGECPDLGQHLLQAGVSSSRTTCGRRRGRPVRQSLRLVGVLSRQVVNMKMWISAKLVKRLGMFKQLKKQTHQTLKLRVGASRLHERNKSTFCKELCQELIVILACRLDKTFEEWYSWMD